MRKWPRSISEAASRKMERFAVRKPSSLFFLNWKALRLRATYKGVSALFAAVNAHCGTGRKKEQLKPVDPKRFAARIIATNRLRAQFKVPGKPKRNRAPINRHQPRFATFSPACDKWGSGPPRAANGRGKDNFIQKCMDSRGNFCYICGTIGSGRGSAW